jgi:hypothetical protein
MFTSKGGGLKAGQQRRAGGRGPWDFSLAPESCPWKCKINAKFACFTIKINKKTIIEKKRPRGGEGRARPFLISKKREGKGEGVIV